MAEKGGDALSSLLPGLTPEEMDKIQKAAREAVAKEQHDKLFKDALEAAKRQARIEAGMAEIDAAPVEEEMIWVDINLPDSITPLGALITDGRCFYHGQRYHVRKAVAMDLNSRMWCAWVQDGRIRGTWSDVNRPKPSAINGQTGGVAGHMPMPVGR